jgi:protein-S-isoprenylcysteine O-methyltransferase Ste14
MLQATVSTIAGLAAWYAVKFVFAFRSVRTAQLLQLLPVLVSLIMALLVWQSNQCSQNIRDKSSTLLVVAACAALLDILLQLIKKNNARYLPPPNASVAVALVYLYSTCITAPEQTVCSVATGLVSATSVCFLLAGAL